MKGVYERLMEQMASAFESDLVRRNQAFIFVFDVLIRKFLLPLVNDKGVLALHKQCYIPQQP